MFETGGKFPAFAALNPVCNGHPDGHRAGGMRRRRWIAREQLDQWYQWRERSQRHERQQWQGRQHCGQRRQQHGGGKHGDINSLGCAGPASERRQRDHRERAGCQVHRQGRCRQSCSRACKQGPERHGHGSRSDQHRFHAGEVGSGHHAFRKRKDVERRAEQMGQLSGHTPANRC